MNEDFVRVVVYVHKKRYQMLKSKLALLGLSVSGWVRKEIDLLLKKEG